MEIVKTIKMLLDGVISAGVPARCLVCGRELTYEERFICLHCLLALPRTRMYYVNGDNSGLLDRLVGVPMPRHAASWFFYDRDSRYAALIREAKYNDRPGLMRHLGRCFAEDAERSDAFSGVDVLMPVPMYGRKEIRRGFNQSEYVALGVSDVTGIPVGDNLEAVRRHSSQTRRSAAQRRRNIAGSFRVESPQELDGLHVALVDDVITSGATIEECIRTLVAQAPGLSAFSIYSLGLARR